MRFLALLLSVVLALSRGGTACAQDGDSAADARQPHVQFALGFGYVRTPCGDPDYDVPCATGARGELGLNLFFKKRSDFSAAFSSSGSTPSRVAEGLAEIPMRAVDGARDPGQVVAAFLFGLLLMIVLFGLIWGVVAVSSQRLKLGLYTSQEVFPKRWQVEGLEDYAAQTTGFQAGFYLFPGADLELRTSVGYVNAQAVQDDRTYNLHGVESRAAFGYSPFNGTGPMLMAEVHTKQFDRGPIRDYLARNVAPTLPAVRRTTAITAGWTLAF